MTEPHRDDQTGSECQKRMKKWEIDYKRDADRKIESFKATMTFAANAIRSAFLLNGGAIIAMLTFWGHLLSRDAERDWLRGLAVSKVGAALTCFTIGLGCAALISVFAYFSQGLYDANKDKRADACRYFAIIGFLVSIILFMWGAKLALDVFAPLLGGA